MLTNLIAEEDGGPSGESLFGSPMVAVMIMVVEYFSRPNGNLMQSFMENLVMSSV